MYSLVDKGVCVCERERERDKQRDRVFVCERERDRDSVRVCVRFDVLCMYVLCVCAT